jgi:hypothetical protein
MHYFTSLPKKVISLPPTLQTCMHSGYHQTWRVAFTTKRLFYKTFLPALRHGSRATAATWRWRCWRPQVRTSLSIVLPSRLRSLTGPCTVSRLPQNHNLVHIYITFSRLFYPKRLTISTFKRNKQQLYITVGTVRIFIATSATIARLTHSLCTTKIARVV